MEPRTRDGHVTGGAYVLGDALQPDGEFIDADGVTWYRIDNVDLLEPFLVNLVTPDDLWAFISSSGALTAGRRSAESSLFPYETDDRLHRSGGRTGPLTLIRIQGHSDVWQPFDPDTPIGWTQRSLAKTAFGDRLRFTERHHELGLTFEYTWATAARFGLVRHCRLTLDADRDPVEVSVLDGLVDVLPAGVELELQQASSTLVDAYRRTELTDDGGLALFTLEALISDRSDPAEALTANAVWNTGLTPSATDSTVLLSERQVRRFRSGLDIVPERLITGTKGAFLQAATARLAPGEELTWMVVADVDLDHPAAVELLELRRRHADEPSLLVAAVNAEIERAHERIGDLVADADGRQVTADERSTVHHFANVLFNCMRGGVFPDDHRVNVDRVAEFVTERDRRRRDRFVQLTADLDPVVEIDTLRQAVAADPDVRRLVNEYLPLIFSRRHGDPSRPWNTFSIPERLPDGSLAFGYQGNWRDIFQNWEALLHSYPRYLESVIAKFLSASTVDGHNPYRITDEGIDWEVPEDGSWGNFGYWGDHQIVYLHRLLDAAARFDPGLLETMLEQRSFSYADVPYRLRSHEELIADPKQTLDFDEHRQRLVDKRVDAIGADGRLVPTEDGSGVHLATMAEKLLVPALAKLSNLVAGGGIWLNTQRPEWNDANNALVGNGVSVVTLLHLRDYLSFIDDLLDRAAADEVEIGNLVVAWLGDIAAAFSTHDSLLTVEAASMNDQTVVDARRHLLDDLGAAYERYRTEAYDRGPGDPQAVTLNELRRLLNTARAHVDTTAQLARRPDGLVHTYWLMELGDGTASLHPLYEMLEGQVAAVSSPTARPEDVAATMTALWDGALHRADQGSFLLYPDRRVPPFLDKNRLPESVADAALAELTDPSVGLLTRDVNGDLHFADHFGSARELEAALDDLARDPAMSGLVEEHGATLIATYEEVFDHRSFTGRSQSMYRYEGLGSIYWHMVSKLLFALEERVVGAIETDASPEIVDELFGHYGRLRSGLGYRKSVALQGTFPTDPHSHTPAGMGAQQPGMTGQVKEGVLIRWAELGVRVAGGRLGFDPVLLDPDEFLTEAKPWEALGPDGHLEPGSLGFTYCTVPVVYRLTDAAADAGPDSVPDSAPVEVTSADGHTSSFATELDLDTSRAVFARTGTIARIDVTVSRARLLAARNPHVL